MNWEYSIRLGAATADFGTAGYVSAIIVDDVSIVRNMKCRKHVGSVFGVFWFPISQGLDFTSFVARTTPDLQSRATLVCVSVVVCSNIAVASITDTGII